MRLSANAEFMDCELRAPSKCVRTWHLGEKCIRAHAHGAEADATLPPPPLWPTLRHSHSWHDAALAKPHRVAFSALLMRTNERARPRIGFDPWANASCTRDFRFESIGAPRHQSNTLAQKSARVILQIRERRRTLSPLLPLSRSCG